MTGSCGDCRKVPAHRELVLAALDGGKAVYCEAPLGRNVAETEEMASAVGSLHTAIGLQRRLNPAVRRAAELVSSREIGRPLSARIVATIGSFGPELPSAYDYFNKISSGANLLTISAGHWNSDCIAPCACLKSDLKGAVSCVVRNWDWLEESLPGTQLWLVSPKPARALRSRKQSPWCK